ncbi:MAG: tRNA uridine-5-carboxymethylaminomethyl(34) synthesis GTPase MnmE [Peptococcaceae bacterium]|nr:tRNA uridine-5-carboxymethylaminomethyl(34) synthesis GTPase MnmE [Peptococcaceae bacterium]
MGKFDETIVALATPPGEAALHLIRLSGSQAEDIMNACFQTRSAAWLRGDVSVLCLGWFCDDGKRIDQIMAARMRGPASFTGENVVEISCHGGMVIVHRILDICCRCGARLAQPGEFSKRAFLNGKIDLVQAEAIIDLINAKNDLSADLALVQLGGAVSEAVKGLRGELLDIVASIEAHIDFPEEEVELVQADVLQTDLIRVRETMQEALRASRTGKIIREGIVTVIAGTPNVGKSSLLNALLGEERAIVTDIPGTTRDEIHESANLGGLLLHLIDTAGLRKSEDPIEILGIARSRKALEQADVVLFMLDATRKAVEKQERMLSEQEREVLVQYADKTIVLVNKTDLLYTDMRVEIAAKPVREAGYELTCIPFSVKARTGFDELKTELRKRFLDGFDMYRQPFLANERQIEAVRVGLAYVEKALGALGASVPFDLVSLDILRALEEVSLITGHEVREDVIERIFARFCIGK